MKKFSDLPEPDQVFVRGRIKAARQEMYHAICIIKTTPDTAELVEWVQGIRGQLSVWMEEKK